MDLDELFSPKVKHRVWMDSKIFVLGTAENLASIIDACIASGRYGIDLETSGLDNRVFSLPNGERRTVDRIAGICLSPDGLTGYYIPIHHALENPDMSRTELDCNVSIPIFDREFMRLIEATDNGKTIAVFHNSMFDQEFLQFNETGHPWGEWGKQTTWDDTLILTYLKDARKRDKRLKTLSEEELDIEQVHLDELFPMGHKGRMDFTTLDPTDIGVLWYACGDAICTRLLYDKQAPAVLEPDTDGKTQKTVYGIEKGCVLATRWMQRNRIHVNHEKLVELILLGHKEWLEAIFDVYEEAAKVLNREVMPPVYKVLKERFVDNDPKDTLKDQIARAEALSKAEYTESLGMIKGRDNRDWPWLYDVNSPQQLGTMFDEMEIPGLRRTEKSGQIKTSKDELERIVEEAGDQFPFMRKIKRFREINKALSTFLYPMSNDSDPIDDTMRINFNPHKVDTGRFATPSHEDDKNRMVGYPAVNFQAIPNSAFDEKKPRPECMRRMRECISVRPMKDGRKRFLCACIAEGSLVQTVRGLCPIETVAAGDLVRTEEGFHKVSWAGPTGQKAVVRLTTSRGYSLRLTPDHQVQTVGKTGFIWKAANDLNLGDWIVQASNGAQSLENPTLPVTPICTTREKQIRTPLKLTLELAVFLGRFMGDGNLSHVRGKLRSVGFALGLDEAEVLPVLNNQTETLFGLKFSPKGRGDVYCWSNPFARWLEEVTKKGSQSICEYQVPPVILQAHKEAQAAFLGGLFDADGSVGSRDGDGVSIWITSERMSQEVQLLLLGLGIPASRLPCHRETNFGEIDGWLITITGIRPLVRFAEIVGMASPRKQKELETLISSGRNRDISNFIPLDIAKLAIPSPRKKKPHSTINNGKRNNRISYESLDVCAQDPTSVCPEWANRLLERDLCFDTVASIAPDGEAQVYDLSVPTAKRFNAGGIIVHNCDFSGVELRLVTNISREPKWLAEFFHCSSCDRTFDRGDGTCTPPPPPPRCPNCGSDKIGDLHALTGIAIYGADAPKAANWKVLRGQSKCVHPDTLIGLQTSDNPEICKLTRIGSFPVAEKSDSFLKLSVETNVWADGCAVPIKETYNGGIKPLFHVVTRRGILTCSDQHGFVMADGSQKSLKTGLIEGDFLKEPKAPQLETCDYPRMPYRPYDNTPKVEIQTNRELAYWAGLFLGDGTKSGENSVGFSHGALGKIDKTGTSYEDWQKILVQTSQAAGFGPVPKKKSVYLGCRNVMRFLDALGLVDGVSGGRRLRVPDWVLDAGKDACWEFLGGLFDTDGTVSKDEASASVTTKDAVFAGQIAAVLYGLGILPAVEPCWNTTYKKWYYRVTLRSIDVPKLAFYMRHPGKKARVRNEVKPGTRLPNKIMKIIPAGDSFCMDLHLDSSDHLYWTNGLLTHNSVNFALCYGGGGNAVIRALKNDIDKNEGWRIKNQFDQTYLGLSTWWKQQHAFATKYAFVRTAFGRKYPLPDIKSEERMFVEKAKRNSVNGPVQGCINVDSRIPTDLGYQNIQDLCDKLFQVWTGKAWKPAKAWATGNKALTKTTLFSGRQISTSPDHKFKAWQDREPTWKSQSNLKVGDWLAVNAQALPFKEPVYNYCVNARAYNNNSKGFVINGNSTELWEFLGMLYGDGSIEKDYLMVHCGDTDDFPEFSAETYAKDWAERLNNALGVRAIVYCHRRREDDTRKPTWQIKIHNKAFRVFCRDILGVSDQNTYTKEFPKALWSESEKHRAAFLRGYFSSDGTASPVSERHDSGGYSVRSTNEHLLRDTQALLGTLGIRASCRVASKRVSVLDRERFRQIIGYNVSFKSQRMEQTVFGYYANQRYALPPSLVQWIGETVYKSSIYAALPVAQKSAVLRLKASSGSKPQCISYLHRLPENEVPAEIWEALQYDYEKVVSTEYIGDLVPMYDIEVFDDDHAFVCDGIVVHNSSADVTKIAMALIYKECKKRDWLDKVQMVATMHDELVFEIDGDVLEEALLVLNTIMTSNLFVMQQKWPIPLTTDTELGYDWSVPWDINSMRAKEVRFNGNKKIKDKEHCPEGMDWDSLPYWPEDLRPFIKEAGGLGILVAPEAVSPPQASAISILSGNVDPGAVPEEVKVLSNFSEKKAMAEIISSGVFEFQLQCPLIVNVIPKLAQVINTCKSNGTCVLVLKAMDGSVLNDWTDKPIKVNPIIFTAEARAVGLLPRN